MWRCETLRSWWSVWQIMLQLRTHVLRCLAEIVLQKPHAKRLYELGHVDLALAVVYESPVSLHPKFLKPVVTPGGEVVA